MDKCCEESFLNCTGLHEECNNCTCSCLSSFTYDPIDNLCKSLKSLHGENCSMNTDCMEGLNCNKNGTCHCPKSCFYVADLGSCNCGRISYETPVEVLVLGFFFGYFSAMLCIICIIRTMKKVRVVDNISTRSVTSALEVNQSATDPNIRLSPSYSILDEHIQERRPSQLVSISHGFYNSLNSPYFEGLSCLPSAVSESEIGRRPTPNPYERLVISPLKSGYRPTAPVNPEYPMTLLNKEDEKLYLEYSS